MRDKITYAQISHTTGWKRTEAFFRNKMEKNETSEK